MESKVADLVELGKVGNALKVVLNEHLDDVYHEQLETRRKKHAEQIKNICNENYTQFISAIDDLMDVTETVGNLKKNLVTLNDDVQTSCKRLENQVRRLQVERHKRRHIDLALRQISRCQNLIHLVQKAQKHVQDKKFINALKILNQLQHHHIPQLSQLEFTQHILNQLPKLRQKIQSSVFNNFQDWLYRISNQCSDLGACAMYQALGALKESKPSSLQPKDADEDLYRKVQSIDFGPVYQCLHVYETLEIDEFETDYKDRRRRMCTQISVAPMFREDGKSAVGFDEYFFSVTGFFVLEQSIVHRYSQLMSQRQMQEHWETVAVPNIKKNLTSAFRKLSDPDVLIEIKTLCVLMCKALESCDLRVSTLMQHLQSELENFCVVLGKPLSNVVYRAQQSDSCYISWMVPDAETYVNQVQRFQLGEKPSDSSTLPFPFEVKFSDTVPKICIAIERFVDKVKLFCKDLPDLDASNQLQYLEKALIRNVADVIDNVNFNQNSQKLKLSQLAQLSVNAQFLEKSCAYFERYVGSSIPLTKARDHFSTFDTKATDTIFSLLNEHIESLMTVLDSDEWNPSKPLAHHPRGEAREWVNELEMFLDTTMGIQLRNMQAEMLSGIHFTACRQISQSIIEKLLGAKKININGMYGISIDLTNIEQWALRQGVESLEQMFNEIRQLLDLFLSNDLTRYEDENIRDKYRYVSNHTLKTVLSKFKPVKMFGSTPPNTKDYSKKEISHALSLAKSLS